MQIIITAKLRGKKGKELSSSTYEYFKLLYGPSYAKLMVAEDKGTINKKN
jgi:hypothetical protein